MREKHKLSYIIQYSVYLQYEKTAGALSFASAPSSSKELGLEVRLNNGQWPCIASRDVNPVTSLDYIGIP